MTRLLGLAAFVGGAVAAASASLPVGDSDMYWHLANALQMFAYGFVRADVYSWTVPGAAVPTDQWLGDALLGQGYLVAGWRGVLAVRTIAIAVLVAAIALAAFVRRPGSPTVALAVALPAIALTRSLWAERPELFGAACFALLVLLLQLPGRAAPLATAPLLIVWANLHGSFALGVALVLLVCAQGLWREPAARVPYVIASLGALIALVATPAGIMTLTTPSTHLLSPPREIQEWAAPDPLTPPGAIWLLVLLLVIATASLSRGARVRDVLTIVPVAMLSLVAIRHTPLLAIAATPYLAERLPEVIGSRLPRRWARRPAPAPRRSAVLGTALAGIALMGAGIAIGPGEPERSAYPSGALASLAPGPGLYAEYDWGGWLIWNAPATPVFVDGRLGLYRDPVLADYVAILEARPGWRDLLARRGVRSLLVRPSDPVAVRAIELGWPVLSRSSGYVLISVPRP